VVEVEVHHICFQDCHLALRHSLLEREVSSSSMLGAL